MSANRCAAFKCGARIAPTFLMCPRHWAMVPGPIKEKVWTAYRAHDRDASLTACLEATKAIVDFEAEMGNGKLDATKIAGRNK
ncbi:hypothetical protein LCGC14_1721190 [marine sediment metagenome]|uniref:Uncharacterized protein n=1 Tax=marine sediment metagenome TaxID=412755 RepID=A0A0F9I034_9ZZZZ